MIVDIKVSELTPHPDNPRVISDESIDLLKKSLLSHSELQIARPLIVTLNGLVLAGNQRLRAYKEIYGADHVITVYQYQHELTKEEEQRIMLLDNGHFGEWDTASLADILDELDLTGSLSEIGLDSVSDLLDELDLGDLGDLGDEGDEHHAKSHNIMISCDNADQQLVITSWLDALIANKPGMTHAQALEARIQKRD